MAKNYIHFLNTTHTDYNAFAVAGIIKPYQTDCIRNGGTGMPYQPSDQNATYHITYREVNSGNIIAGPEPCCCAAGNILAKLTFDEGLHIIISGD